VLVRGLRELGYAVEECHRPVWERTRHKAGAFLAPAALARTGGRFVAAWAGLALAERRAGLADAVVVGYPAQPDALPAWLVARRRGAPLVADMMISLADTLAGDRARAGRVVGAALAGLDRATLRLADLALADTLANAEWMASRFRVPAGRIAVVPVGADAERFPPAPPPPGPPRALFYGKLAPLHGLPIVLDAARLPGVPPVRVVGEGQLGPWLAGQLRRDPPPGLEHIPWIPYERLGAAVADAAICLGVFGTSAKAARVVPNKVWQAMAVGRAIVTADTPAAREVLRDGRDALLVPPGDALALAERLRALGEDEALRARLAAAARARYEALGTPRAVAGRAAEALGRLAGTTLPA
jgi:glycosyltransferase involved in cell wall biosynthesis